MTEVFIVHSGCMYEGGTPDGVFSTYERAKSLVDMKLYKYRLQSERSSKMFKDLGVDPVWEQIDKFNWNDGYDFICIIPTQVDDCKMFNELAKDISCITRDLIDEIE